jgi:hypothetical protein
MVWCGVQHLFGVAMVAFLAACGGSGGGGTGAGGGGGGSVSDPRLGRLDQYEAQKLVVLGNPAVGAPALPVTHDDLLPVDGTASFTGSATIRVELPGDPLVLYGDATVNVAFDGGPTAGRLENFFGSTANGRVSDYDGEITLSGAAATQNTGLAYAGSLGTAAQTLEFGGTLGVLYLGTPVTAVAGADLEATVTVNGTVQDATVIVVGQGVVVAPDPIPPS